jgi:YidC/Oxa1 family membrane protein insertase
MDNQRVFVWAALALVLWLNYTTWQRDYAPAPIAPAAAAPSSAANVSPAEDTLPALPSETATPQQQPAAAPAPTGQPVETAAESKSAVIRITTDVLSMDISTRGGELVRADLLKYPLVKNRPDVPVRLLSPTPPVYVARSGLRAADNVPQPNHLAIFRSEASEYSLKAGEAKLVVPLTWSEGGLTVTKTYTFYPGTYRIDLTYDVTNQTGSDWKAASYVQLVRHYEHVERSYFRVETYAYRGPAIFDGKGYKKLDVEDEEDRAFKGSYVGGWMAALQHHFVAAAVPPQQASYDYQLSLNAQNDFTLGYRGPLTTVANGATQSFKETLFVGPKLQEQLQVTGPKLERVADYGKLTVISQPLFWLLEKVHNFVRNWGLAIIIVTFLIKLVGCLPILIQIPFFLAFYWVLLESVEMRQAPFFAWITDLSVRDPYFILPILMGAAMYGQFKLQPMPSTDPMQAKVFAFMPVIMSVTMAWFPAGLVLYWLTNTLLSIAQQWRINKLVAAEQQHAKT